MKKRLSLGIFIVLVVCLISVNVVSAISESCTIHLVDKSEVTNSIYGTYFGFYGENNQYSDYGLKVQSQEQYLFWFVTQYTQLALPGTSKYETIYHGDINNWRLRLESDGPNGCYGTGTITKLN